MENLVHRGHRQRMKRKFSDFGHRVFDTYELLEMLLYNTVPVKDTNPLAKSLLSHFGSLEGVLSADKAELMKVDGIGEKTAELITTAAKALYYVVKGDGPTGTVLETYSDIGEYLLKYFENISTPRIVMLSLDNRMKLIGVDELYELDYASGGVKAAPFITAAVKNAASVVVVAHNHLHGVAYPTEGDRATNQLIDSCLFEIGVTLAEHYIISGGSYLGFMEHLDSAFSQSTPLGTFIRSKKRAAL